MQQNWEQRLRSAYNNANVRGRRNRPIKLPSGISFAGEGEEVQLSLSAEGVMANMQDDAAAFEAWALALLIHCGVQSVQICVDPGVVPKGPHYERFLYRLKRFSELFPDHVNVKWPDCPSKALDSKIERFLNQPNPRKKPPEVDSKERMKAASRPKPSESHLELALEISGAFRSRFQLEKVLRQWPVGLFNERVADGNQIFTGGKSGIDLIGIRGDTLVLFELKKSGNEKAGALSELLFYASVMRDAIGASAIFKFESKKAKNNCGIGPEDILRCSNICAVLLAPKFHPLISEPRMFEKLNAAIEGLYVEEPIHFETVTISGYPQDEYGDFKFGTGRSEI